MNVVIFIDHYPHVNFFKNAIQEITAKGIDIILIVQPRGNLTKLVEYELKLPYISIGHHQPSIIKKALNLLGNEINIFKYLVRNDCDVMTGVGSIELTHSAFVLRKPSIIFGDDIEYRLAYYLLKYFATNIVLPSCVPAKGRNIFKYKGFKELAYLHPNHFTPKEDVLREYNLKSNNYVFIREVSSSSVNYRGLKEGSLASLCPEIIKMGLDIVLSLENTQLKNLFEKYCIILKEPVSDIHSLMSYAAFTITSGDSIARESCLLGTPAIYTGGRRMSINVELQKKGCLFQCKPNREQILSKITLILGNNLKDRTKQVIDGAIRYEWEDTTQVIVNCLLAAIYKDNSLSEKYRIVKQ